MKYKDLRSGDWFTYNGAQLVHTEYDIDIYYDFYLDNLNFGHLYEGYIDDEDEVDFLTNISYNKPFSGEKEFTLKTTPSFVLCCPIPAPEMRFIVFRKHLICVADSYKGGYNGKWNNIDELYNADIEVIEKADLDFPEEKLDRLKDIWSDGK